MEKGSRMISPEEIGHVVALSRQWADRPPDRILFERSDLDPQVRSQVALQVALLDKMAKKIPHFLECGGYIPRRVNFEQCSSEPAARYKQRLLSPSDRILDMTGGLGIDTAAMASVTRHSEVLEIEPEMAAALEYNLSRLLPPGRATVTCGDALARLDHTLLDDVTMVYADPARRDMADPGRRLSSMADYTPAPLQILLRLQELDYGGRLLLKLSPMLDIHWLLEQLPTCTDLHILQVGDEVKELLLDLSMQPATSPVTIHLSIVDRQGEVTSRSYPLPTSLTAETPYATQIESYIHIPRPVLMKSGAYHLIAAEQGISLLGPNTHLYTSPRPAPDPLYKSYRVLEEIPYSKSVLKGKALKSLLERYPALSVMSRHFPLTAEELRGRLRTDESDRYFLLATTLGERDRKLLILSRDD